MLNGRCFYGITIMQNHIIGIIAAICNWNRNYGCMPQDVQGQRFLIRGVAFVIAMVLAVVVCVNMICFGPMATLIGLGNGKWNFLSDETNEEAAK